jgi:saccharopine dehydrogenase-like NADP-dependent oxidoreductase
VSAHAKLTPASATTNLQQQLLIKQYHNNCPQANEGFVGGTSWPEHFASMKDMHLYSSNTLGGPSEVMPKKAMKSASPDSSRWMKKNRTQCFFKKENQNRGRERRPEIIE